VWLDGSLKAVMESDYEAINTVLATCRPVVHPTDNKNNLIDQIKGRMSQPDQIIDLEVFLTVKVRRWTTTIGTAFSLKQIFPAATLDVIRAAAAEPQQLGPRFRTMFP
jgi:hypothetical protein